MVKRLFAAALAIAPLGATACPSAVSAASASALSSLDPATIASKIINDPGAPEVRGADARLIDDANVTGGRALRVMVPRKGKNLGTSR